MQVADEEEDKDTTSDAMPEWKLPPSIESLPWQTAPQSYPVQRIAHTTGEDVTSFVSPWTTYEDRSGYNTRRLDDTITYNNRGPTTVEPYETYLASYFTTASNLPGNNYLLSPSLTDETAFHQFGTLQSGEGSFSLSQPNFTKPVPNSIASPAEGQDPSGEQYSTTKVERRPAWGGSRPGRRPSADSKGNKRPRVGSRRTSSDTANSSESHGKERITHNAVEKKYRTRLNIQFEELLQQLPAEMREYNVDERWDDIDGPERKISKAQVLMLARKYILDLERTGQKLSREAEELKEKNEQLERDWVAHGGALMP